MARKNLEDALRPGETFVWTGAPVAEKNYNHADRLLLPVNIVCLLLSVFFAVALALSVHKNGFSPKYAITTLMLMLFGGISVYAYFFRFGVKRRAKAELSYGLTDTRRLVILDGKTFVEYDAEALRDAAVTEEDKNGAGTIYLVPRTGLHFLDNCGLDVLAPEDGAHIALFDIADVKKVCRLLRGKKH